VEGPPSGVNDPGRGVTEVGGYAVATGLWVSRDYIIIIIIIIIVEETSSTVRAERHRRWQSSKQPGRIIIFTHQDCDVMSDSSTAAVLYGYNTNFGQRRWNTSECARGCFALIILS